MQHKRRKRRVCFVTGTRAEFGLMRRTLEAIQAHPNLQLQILVTGMHLDRSRGFSAGAIARSGWKVDARVRWQGRDLATATGSAISGIARELQRLRTDIVLVVGDRVEAFAGATAGHLSGRAVAHVHGGDRALGQVDDSLRHAITKLSHVHLAATRESADRLIRLGEDRRRVHQVGSPGIDGIASDASRLALPVRPSRYALLVLHPADDDESMELRRARLVLQATAAIGFDNIVIVYPNNDPGAAGIVQCWETHAKAAQGIVLRNVARGEFLGLLRDAAVLVGNSSSGIIEAASFGTPVVDIGPRQQGRQRGENVTNVPYRQAAIVAALKSVWRGGKPLRYAGRNIYGGTGTSGRIAAILSTLPLDARTLRKLIAY